MAISDGEKIRVVFSEDLVGDVTGTERHVGGWKYVERNTDDIQLSANNTISGSTYLIEHMFDGKTSTYWQGGSPSTNWVQMDFGEGNAEVLNEIQIYTNSYYIKQCSACGSNDGTSWFELVSAADVAPTGTSGWHTIMFHNNTTAYRYYRIDHFIPNSTSYVNIYGLKPLVGVGLGNEVKMQAQFLEYNFVPDGTLHTATRTPDSVEIAWTVDDYISLGNGQNSSTLYSLGAIQLAYA